MKAEAMNNLIEAAAQIPVSEPLQTISISPFALEAPGRNRPLELRITLPTQGANLPVILLSHGAGPSLYLPSKDGYGPTANFFAEHGFAVIQPTHANSKVAGLPTSAPGAPLFWRERVGELTLILDHLTDIERGVPAIAGRLDLGRIAAVGHSMGSQTVAMLLGARLTDAKHPADSDVDLYDARIKAGVLLAPPGNGGVDLAAFAAENYSFMNPDYSRLVTRTLVVYGDADVNPHLTTRGPGWPADAYHAAPGADSLLTLFGGKHGLGGVAGYDARETDDEDPERLAVTLRMSWAYLRSALYDNDPSWDRAQAGLALHGANLARVDTK
jgi:predicted dienelactone hydrolase